DKLFSPFSIGNTNLANRIVMAPLTRTRALGNVPNELMAQYYGQRATAGLIITEGTSPSPNGLGYPNIPGVFSPEQVAGWQLVTSAVHEKGGKIFLQIMHTGRITHIDNLPEGGEVVAPSAVESGVEMYTLKGKKEVLPIAREMSKADIEHAIEEHVQAAKNAIEAGFDGVELHGANGYLIEQFIHPHTNRRQDEYGGSIENRIRFAVEVARRVVAAIGADRVGIRLSPFGQNNNMPLYDTIEADYLYLAEQLSEVGLVYAHMVDHSSMGAAEVPRAFKQRFRAAFTGAFILSGGYDAERAESDLQDGLGDLVAFGRPYIANPDLVERLKTGAELNVPNPATFYSPGPEGYVDYPALEAQSSE
ncbi:MAG: alkene reductase, partial [Bacteroidota bacterium]